MSRLSLYIKGMAFAALVFALQGCSAEDPGDPTPGGFGPEIRVSAHIADHVFTRSYIEQGPVESGEYYLSYPNTNRDYTVAIVDFEQEKDVTPGLGIVHTLAGGELKWSDIGGSPVDFYLDNVSDDYGTGPQVDFSTENPFVAGVFDAVDGSNDLLWGSKSVNSGTRSLGFDLHHYMSRVKVVVEVVHKDYAVEDITLEGATVELTNLYSTPQSYNRLDGSLALDENSYGSIKIVDPSATAHDWVDTDASDEEKTVYYSPDIVLPPQNLAEDYTRSQLKITLQNGDVYTGILPHAMMIADPKDNTLNYPVTLAFLKEYVMTIRTVITEEPPQLAFMPVWVVGWVDKGEFNLEAHQSGIYSAAEFYRLTAYYKALNEYQLVRYGYLTTQEGGVKVWLFNIFSSLTLNYNDIFGMMKPGVTVPDKGLTKNFMFEFNNYSVYVQNGSEEDVVQVNPTQLYGIVTGTLNWNQLQR